MSVIYCILSVVTIIGQFSCETLPKECTISLDMNDCENFSYSKDCKKKAKLQCENLNGEIDIPKNLNIKEYDHIELNNTKNLINFPKAGVFSQTKLKKLSINGALLPFWKSPGQKRVYMNPLHSLKTFKINNVKGVHNWNWMEVSEFCGNQLTKLFIENCRLVRLRKNTINIYSKLEILSITHCQVQWLDPGSLDCPVCTEIHLNNNNIKEIRKDVFGSGPKSLGILNLRWIKSSISCSYNKIKRLPAGNMFHFIVFNPGRYEPYFTLNIEQNPIAELKRGTFLKFIESLKYIISISIRDAGFKCNCEHKWLDDRNICIKDLICKPNKSGERNMLKFLKDNCKENYDYFAM